MKNFQRLDDSAPKSSNRWMRRLGVSCAVLGLFAGVRTVADELPKLEGPLKRLGSVELHVATKTVVATGFVEQTSGVLDYLVCGLNGRRYEGLVTVEVSAIDLQTALLLAGAKAGKAMTGRDVAPPEGTPVNIWIEWETNGVKKVYPGEELVWNQKEQKPVKTEWRFNGSRVVEGRFAATEDDNLIAVRWDPNSIINIADELGRTYGDVFVNRKLVPESNTPVRVYLQPVKP